MPIIQQNTKKIEPETRISAINNIKLTGALNHLRLATRVSKAALQPLLADQPLTPAEAQAQVVLQQANAVPARLLGCYKHNDINWKLMDQAEAALAALAAEIASAGQPKIDLGSALLMQGKLIGAGRGTRTLGGRA